MWRDIDLVIYEMRRPVIFEKPGSVRHRVKM
jgi:hypothetical protein